MVFLVSYQISTKEEARSAELLVERCKLSSADVKHSPITPPGDGMHTFEAAHAHEGTHARTT